ncbi:hypothetical protein [Gorillibacterium sp. sgz500922]|uniref:hypothetical protein n=1 Tax=Gorillibacterium sp. sgz500922 TaxID=3446694 RepID=UPI003F67AD3C
MKDRYDELRRASWNLPAGMQKLAVLEEMIRIADLYLTEEDAYDIRMDYTQAASDAGRSERMLVSFAWCLAQFEQHPDKHSEFSLLWYYKWILNMIWKLPELSLGQVDGVFEDFRTRYESHGYSLRPYYQQLVNYRLSQGQPAEAQEAYRLWRATPRDQLADCRACEQNLFGDYHFTIGHLKRGMQALKPILDGRMRCHALPQNTYSLVLFPYFVQGDTEKAAEVARKAFRELQGPEYLEEYAVLLEYLALTDLPKAAKLYDRTIGYAVECRLGWTRLHYFYAVRQFLREWHKTRRRKRLALSDRVSEEWADREVKEQLRRFDERNGNTAVSDRFAAKEQQYLKLRAREASR